jgi:sugar/nucleoside kinase (ribokinase family)
MPHTYDVLTFGDMCVDLILTGQDVTPQFGQVEKLVDDYILEMGGSCCLFACQAARLDLRTGVIGKVGNDDFGRFAKRRLDEYGVDTQHVLVDANIKTGLGVALSKENDRAILTYLGSISAVTGEDAKDEILSSARHLHHGSFFLHKGLRSSILAIFKRAKDLGLSTSLDPNWDPEEQWNSNLLEILPYTDLFMPNEQEALLISKNKNLKSATRWLLEKGVGAVVVKQGKKGASYSNKDEQFDLQVLPVRGGDSVGAGDSFNAGFLAGWLRGISVQNCLQMGVYCGRSVASKFGGLAGQPRMAEVLSNLDNLRS